ncbi:hypothetical protein PFICI_07542 [Pestalotiopsis fici W106-1]|uniref:Uncharacterized protein n=1 Tax=Pestalotiopsis fici (strain W106-1 / CGMCC3.15140) TaxID=1229662 RepID=W3X1K2_PESFW|nr:uncharacterized protein PFICI_07542 [Pestalotiopsis fici W106-1]ETS80013.1 hypothetical protein PFICI_07542 [Pestalotiopsis fici W106-1]
MAFLHPRRKIHHLSLFTSSSPHSLPSPDGKFIATLLPAQLRIRAVQTLTVERRIKVPADLAASTTTFVWSPNSQRLLLSAGDEIHVFSVVDDDFHATVRNPTSSVAKSTFVDFGATDREACVCSAHGIKLSLFNLASAKVVEISNPKFYAASTAARGISYRPLTHHLALLTRSSGKDFVSIHTAESREVQRSWSPDVVDAQGLSWTPDGKWLVVWESAAQGHRVSFFTPDGHKYRDWCGPLLRPGETHERWGAGVKVVTFSSDSQYVAIGDYGRSVSVLPTANLAHELRLCHPLTLEPKDTLQIWQEQFDLSDGQGPVHRFVKASQPVAPVARTTQSGHELKTGPLFMLFDQSATLLAMALEDAPSTLWIWDVAVTELRAVLMFHAEIARIEWHPSQSELLLVRCEGQDHAGLVFVWDPLSDGPTTVDFKSQLSAGQICGKPSAYWLRALSGSPTVFFTDAQSYMLVSVTDSDENDMPWLTPSSVDDSQAARFSLGSTEESNNREDSDMGDDESQPDDTFHFKRFGVE